MTVLVAGFVTGLALLAGGIFGVFTDAAADRTRAQAAADAGALAAVAESVPGAAGSHHSAAERLASANGAALISCEDCTPGTTSVIVTVELDDVEARARATLDPNAFLPLQFGFDGRGLKPEVRDAVTRLIAAAQGEVRLVSGWRSPERQRQLWSAALQKYGDPEVADNWVARPGTSFHERGLAVDLGGDLAQAAALVERLDLPLHRPLPNEPWHFELVGSR